MVIDSSILLAIIFNESYAGWAIDQLGKGRHPLLMSTVNLTEVLIRVRDRQPQGADEVEPLLTRTGIEFIPPTIVQARLAADARMLYPLNLGDCFAYALAKVEKLPLLTLDHDFKKSDLDVIIPNA